VYDLVAKLDQPKPTEFAPAMGEGTGILPGLPAGAGKPVHVGFDGGRLTSDGGILLLAAIEQRLKIAERLAACIEDPRDPDRVLHGVAEMIRYRERECQKFRAWLGMIRAKEPAHAAPQTASYS
jgi:Transposase DDE domain group 1